MWKPLLNLKTTIPRNSFLTKSYDILRFYSNETPSDPNPEFKKEGILKSTFSLTHPIERMILRSRITADLDLARFLAKAATLTIYSVAGVTVLGTLGVDTKPIIAGIGVTGFTIGFALKEIATNFLSGVLLMLNKPFYKGQHLKVMGPASGLNLEGEVESIDARYVLLRTKDRGLLMVPSVMVYTNPILVSNGGSVLPPSLPPNPTGSIPDGLNTKDIKNTCSPTDSAGEKSK